MSLWEQLKEHTQARIGLHRVGHAISTKELLEFKLAQALAHDAVQETWDLDRFEKVLEKIGEKPLIVYSEVSSRDQYLKYPNLGRLLDEASRTRLFHYAKTHPVDIAFIATDGLSPKGIDNHMIPFWKVFLPLLKKHLGDLKVTLVLVPFGRVAISDEIGSALKARESVIFVGERPGLSSFDSLGIYVTYNPKHGNTDANRNCISNIHPPEGLSYELAAEKLINLLKESFRLKLSGVNLKEIDRKMLS